MPPIVLNDEQAVLLDVRDRDPDLVDVADERQRRRAVPRAHAGERVPIVSDVTSANSAAASRQTAARGLLVARGARQRSGVAERGRGSPRLADSSRRTYRGVR